MQTNKYPILLALLVLFVFSSSLSSQTMQRIGSNLYEYKGQVYKYQDMDHIFSQNADANWHYIKAIQKRKKAKTLGAVAIASSIIGAISLLGAGERETVCDTTYFLNIPFLPAFSCSQKPTAGEKIGRVGISTGIISGFFSLLFIGKKRKSQKASLNSFNADYSMKLPKKNPLDIQLVVSNGLGIQLNF